MTWPLNDTQYTSFQLSGVVASLCQVQAKCAVYVNVYYYKVIVHGWEVVLLGGTVHISTAQYGLMYSTVFILVN